MTRLEAVMSIWSRSCCLDLGLKATVLVLSGWCSLLVLIINVFKHCCCCCMKLVMHM